MIDKGEIVRRIDNLVNVGTISEIDADGKALVRVNVLGRVTWWMPVMMFANSFKQSFAPVRVGEQVLVICPGGQADSGVVLRGIFNTECMEPEGSSRDVEKTTYEDGSWFSYDSSSNQLKGEVKGDVELTATKDTTVTVNGNATVTVNKNATVAVNENATVTVNKNATVTAGGDIDVDAKNVTCDATSIKLNEGAGVVTGESICHFTGSPHVDVSKTVFAGKD